MPALERELGVPVVPMNARKGLGLAALRIVMAEQLAAPPAVRFWAPTEALLPLVRQIRYYFNLHNDYLALHYAHQFQQLRFLSDDDRAYLQELTAHYHFDSTAEQARETVARYGRINELLLEAVTVTRTERREPASNRIDKVLTHRVFGYLIFLGVLFGLFEAIFSLAQYPMDAIDRGIAALSAFIQAHAHGPLVRLLTEGVLAGLGGVLIFIPQIALLFAFLAVLEETGYMARVTFLMDKLMRPFGLSGKSVVPLISGLACAVPAIMGARTIESWKDRMLTIFVTPLMSCSARIPVYTVLVALVVPDQSWLGIFNLRGLVLLGLYLLGLTSALLSALLLENGAQGPRAQLLHHGVSGVPLAALEERGPHDSGESESFRAASRQGHHRHLGATLGVGFLRPRPAPGPGRSPGAASSGRRRPPRSAPTPTVPWPPPASKRPTPARLATCWSRPSARWASTGKSAFRSSLPSPPARCFVGTMSTIYSVGQDADLGTVQQKLANEKDLQGRPFFTPVRALSLLVFYVFAMQCMSTLAVTYRETKSWRWPLGQLIYMTGLAYLASLLVWQVFSLRRRTVLASQSEAVAPVRYL